MDQLLKLNQHIVTCAPMPLQIAIAQNYEAIWRQVKPQIIDVVARRNDVSRLLQSHNIQSLPGDATYYIFAKISESGLSSREFAEKLLMEHDVSVVAGIGYGDSCDGFIRISVGAESPERIANATGRIAALLSS